SRCARRRTSHSAAGTRASTSRSARCSASTITGGRARPSSANGSANGDLFDADTTRVGVRTTPWERAQLQSSINQRATEYGPRLFANTGLTQGWQLNERWVFDFGVDQSKTIAEPGAPAVEPFNPAVPLASGTLDGDFLAT